MCSRVRILAVLSTLPSLGTLLGSSPYARAHPTLDPWVAVLVVQQM